MSAGTLKTSVRQLRYEALRTSQAYDEFLNASHMKVKAKVEEVEIPPVLAIAVSGGEPPAANPFQDAVAVLYGVAYSVKMGLKFGKLSKPKGYFDYRVGALGAFWWSTGPVFDIADADTVRWQAYLLVPAFVSPDLVDDGRRLAQTTIEALHRYAADHGLSIAGRHHEIYISDPRRTKPEKLKTVIRLAVKAGRR